MSSEGARSMSDCRIRSKQLCWTRQPCCHLLSIYTPFGAKPERFPWAWRCSPPPARHSHSCCCCCWWWSPPRGRASGWATSLIPSNIETIVKLKEQFLRLRKMSSDFGGKYQQVSFFTTIFRYFLLLRIAVQSAKESLKNDASFAEARQNVQSCWFLPLRTPNIQQDWNRTNPSLSCTVWGTFYNFTSPNAWTCFIKCEEKSTN